MSLSTKLRHSKTHRDKSAPAISMPVFIPEGWTSLECEQYAKRMALPRPGGVMLVTERELKAAPARGRRA